MSKPRRLTDEELYGLYLDMGCEKDDDTRADVIDEMRQVVDARSNREAAKAIDWWDGWSWGAMGLPITWVSKYRKKAAELAGGEGDGDVERVER